MIFLIDSFLYTLSIYFICGLIFGCYVIFFAAAKTDGNLIESKKRVRLLLLPGLVATWPFFMYRVFNKNGSQNATLSLKKIHVISWFLIILIIPQFIYRSTKSLEFTDTQLKERTEITPIKKGTVSAENEIIALILKNNQLSLSVKKSLKSASSLVYSCDKEGNKLNLLGQLNSNTNYSFATESNIKGVVIYDSIKNKTITKLLFP